MVPPREAAQVFGLQADAAQAVHQLPLAVAAVAVEHAAGNQVARAVVEGFQRIKADAVQHILHVRIIDAGGKGGGVFFIQPAQQAGQTQLASPLALRNQGIFGMAAARRGYLKIMPKLSIVRIFVAQHQQIERLCALRHQPLRHQGLQGREADD